jgi:hypothetical protein
MKHERSIAPRVARPLWRANAIAKPAEQKPVRALTLIDKLSAGWMTFRIPDKASSPHLRPGEFAVVDLSDRSPQHGELFLIQSSSGERNRYIQQSTRTWMTISSSGMPEKTWWLRDLAGWRQEGTDPSGIPMFSGMSDGPMKKKGLKKMIVGRIIGYADSDLGNELEPCAGWAD